MAEQTNLPSIPPPNENNLVAFARAVKEALEVRLGRRGQGLDAMVTFRDLDKVQMVQGDGRGGVLGLKPPTTNGTAPDPGYDPVADLAPPPAPQNVKASGAVRNVILEWDGPPSTYRNHAYAEIWRSSTNNLNDAAQIGQSGSTMYVDNVGEGQARYYWVRFVSQANVTGPWHAAGDAGVQAATAIDVGYTLGLLEGQIGEDALATETINGKDAFVFDTKTFAIRFNETGYTPFVVQSTPTTINGVEIPAGVYLDAAFMRTFVAQAGQIGALAVDDAAIANLSAAKLTAGDGTIGGILKSANYVSGVSGWAVHPTGWAEFANATVRGTVYADTGWFKGQIIGGAATTYTAGTGMWTGVDAGTWKFRLGSSGTYLRWDGASLTLRGTLTIEDGSGNVLLSSGAGVPWDRISGTGKPADGATKNTIYRQSTTPSGATNGDIWIDTSVTPNVEKILISGTWQVAATAGATFATGQAGSIAGQITPSNVTTYIANAAIGNAQIGGDIWSSNYVYNSSGWYLERNGNLYCANAFVRGNVEASSLKANTLMVNRANIVNAAVDTLQIAGNAVTVPVSGESTTASSLYLPYADFGGGSVQIILEFSVSGGLSAGHTLFCEVIRGGTIIKTYSLTHEGNATSRTLSGIGLALDAPGSGAHQYWVRFRKSDPSYSVLLPNYIRIICLGVKR